MKAPTIVIASLLVGTASATCTKSFDGAQFLRAAASRGLAFKSPEKCLTVQLQNNTFFAPPDTTCKLVLPAVGWLGDGFAFQGIQASGKFEAEPRTDGIHITVLAGAGMKFDLVAVTAAQLKCDALSVEDVFIGAVHVTSPTPPKDSPPPAEKPPEPATHG